MITRRVSLFALVVALVAPARARAIDPRSFEPPLSAGAILGLDTARILGPLVPFATLAVSFADDEIDDVTTRLVAHLVAGFAPIDPLEVAVGASLHHLDDDLGPGDVRVGVKLRMTPRDARLGVALALATSLPTGGPRYATEGGLVIDGRAIADVRGEDLVATLALGYRLRPGGALAGVEVDDELRFGLGVEGRLVDEVTIVSELEGAFGLSVRPDARSLPLELRLGARVRIGDWAITAAAGTRLSDGYGVPDVRLIAAFSWAPPPFRPRAPVSIARPTPRFSEPPPVDLSVVLAHDPDADADGVPLPHDQCPDEPEDHDGFRDGDGCPDPDNDGDGVPDGADACPIDKEIVNGLADHDGCPDELPVGPDGRRAEGPRVDDQGLIRLPGVIEFRSGSDELLPEAVTLLAQVARFLQANPRIERVRIEGHTDDRGDDEEEQVDLSERRAASVRKALMAQGVAGDRLLPKGFGKTRPLTDNRDDRARQINRRVELRIIERPDGGRGPDERGAP